MNSINSCPECAKSLSAKAKCCSCGWREMEKPAVADHRCGYSIAERRCPLPGTISPYIYGNSLWYCRRHYHTLGDPKLGEAELLHIEKNYQQIINDEYSDWRKKLFNHLRK